MNDFSSEGDAGAERNEARSRVEAYLRALQVTDAGQQEKILERILEQAAAKKSERPNVSLTALAMSEIHFELERWFGQVVGLAERAPVRGMVALSALGAAEKWPGVFLASEVPPDFQQAMQKCEVRAAPDLSVSRMVPQPFTNPLEDLKLPAPLDGLAKDLAPLVTKVFAFLVSLSLWTDHRFR